MKKRVSFGTKPSNGINTGSADDWVSHKEHPAEPIKRLTIDIPKSLHKRVKTGCAIEDLDMATVVRDFLEMRFPAKQQTQSLEYVSTETQKHEES